MGIEKFKHSNMQTNSQPKRSISEESKRRQEWQKEERRIKGDRDKESRFLVTKSIAAMGVMIMMAVVILVRFNSIYAAQAQISTLNTDVKNLSESNEDLSIKISESVSLEKLEKIAKEKLGMVYPSKDDAINIVP